MLLGLEIGEGKFHMVKPRELPLCLSSNLNKASPKAPDYSIEREIWY